MWENATDPACVDGDPGRRARPRALERRVARFRRSVVRLFSTGHRGGLSPRPGAGLECPPLDPPRCPRPSPSHPPSQPPGRPASRPSARAWRCTPAPASRPASTSWRDADAAALIEVALRRGGRPLAAPGAGRPRGRGEPGPRRLRRRRRQHPRRRRTRARQRPRARDRRPRAGPHPRLSSRRPPRRAASCAASAAACRSPRDLMAAARRAARDRRQPRRRRGRHARRCPPPPAAAPPPRRCPARRPRATILALLLEVGSADPERLAAGARRPRAECGRELALLQHRGLVAREPGGARRLTESGAALVATLF